MEKNLELTLEILCDGDTITNVEIALSNDGRFRWVCKNASDQLKKRIEEWIDCYLSRKATVLPPISLEGVSPFSYDVLEMLKIIPIGTVVTYGELAKKLGCPKGYRAVGNACGINPTPLFIPCHRVVAANGIGGFSAGLEIKRRLLAWEKIAPFTCAAL